MRRHRFLLTLLCAVCSFTSLAAIEVRSRHYTTADGLANNTVRYVLQDSKGFLWMCTLNGLSRYDGNDFVNFLPVANAEGPSLMDHRVRRMQEDGNGLLWIDVFSEQQCCFDLRQGRFVDFTGCGEYAQHYSSTLAARNGDVWMWSGQNGCRRIVRTEEGFTSYTYRKEEGNIASSHINRIIEDAQGRIWALSDIGVHRMEGDRAVQVIECESPIAPVEYRYATFVSKDGHVYAEQKNGEFKEVDNVGATVTSAMMLKGELCIFSSKSAVRNGIVERDNRGNYWIHNGTGVVRYVNAETGEAKSFRLITEEQLPYIDYERYSFVHDSRDIVWISTYGNGLFAYDLKTDELQHFRATINGQGSIPSDYLLSVAEDRAGGIWVCSEFSGVSCITVQSEGTEYIYPEGIPKADDRSNLIRMLTNIDGQIYAGTRRGGLYVYSIGGRASLPDPKTQDIHSRPGMADLLSTRPLVYSSTKRHFPFNIYTVAKDADGRLWLGSRGGGVCIDGTWYRHVENDSTSLACDHVFSLYCDRQGRMWVGTFDGGLNLAVRGDDGRYTFRHFLNKTYNQSQVRIINSDRDGNLWVGTSEGVYIMSSQSSQVASSQVEFIPLPAVKTICRDSKDRMWVGTSGEGVYMYDGESSDTNHLSLNTKYDTSDGLVDDMVQAVVEDHEGRIWISTEYGISCLDPDRGIFENYFFSTYALGNIYSDNSGCVTEDGRVMFGSSFGLVVITPDKVSRKNVDAVPAVTLTALKVNGILVNTGEADSPLTRAMPYVDEIKLSYNQNSFEVDFSIFDYSKDGAVKYIYRLDNFDKTWSAPSTLNFAAYKNLPHGSYLLRVKACNALGVWGDTETTLRIEIAPPFWKSGWAYLIYMLLFVAAVWFLLHVLHRFTVLRNRIAVEKQLTEFKLQFFTNISHEFRTPLTLIQGALERMEGINHSPQMEEALRTARKSVKRMLRLINQLLEFRKMQHNKLSLSLEEADIIAFLRDIYLSFTETAEKKRMAYQFLPSVKSYRMYFDRENLDKVTYNLLSNAFKYTPSDGKVTFTVTVDEARQQLRLSVADTGVGIPKEKRGELFSRFMQSSFSNDSIGVGLHLTHELVGVHHGTIVYAENEGGGSVFTVTLPTDKTVYEEKDFRTIGGRASLPDQDTKDTDMVGQGCPTSYDDPTVPLNSHKLLIIEDDDDVREFLTQELGQYFKVVSEADGTAGLERARTEDVDLIVCDVMMPGLSGLEVTRRLKDNFDTSHIPIILLTALSAEEQVLKGVESGADAYVTKPFSPKLLLARICKLIEQREKLREKFSTTPTMTRPAICSSQQDKTFADQLQAVMERQIANSEFSVDDFASEMHLGRTIFYRKVRGVTGYTPNEYMRIIRMRKAAELLTTTRCTILDIACQVGLNDPFYFSKCFKQQFGVTPSAYQKGQRPQ